MNHDLFKVYYSMEFPNAEGSEFYKLWCDSNGNKQEVYDRLRKKYGVIDIVGNKIEVGDHIAYSISKSRSALLFIYKVLEVKEDGKLKAQAIDMVTRWGTPTKASTLLYPESRALKIK